MSGTVTDQTGEPEPGFDQDFELISHTSEFNPQRTTITSFYLENDTGGRAIKIPSGDREVTVTTAGADYVSDTWVEEDSDEFNFNNIATLRHHNNTAYEGWIRDSNTNAVKKVLFESYEGRGTIQIEISGPEGDPEFPNPGDLDIPDPGRINIGDTDGDGIIDTNPPLENPTFEIPDTEQPAYLQTGVFLFDGEPCAGIRYYDPSGETTEFDYDFSASGTTYSDTVTFDDPVGYYEECLETQTITGIDESADNLPSNGSEIPEFNFTALSGGSSFGGSVDLGGSGSDVTNTTGVFGEPAGGSDGGGVGVPVSGGSGSSTPWWILAGLAVAGWFFREDIGPAVSRVSESIGGLFRR